MHADPQPRSEQDNRSKTPWVIVITLVLAAILVWAFWPAATPPKSSSDKAMPLPKPVLDEAIAAAKQQPQPTAPAEPATTPAPQPATDKPAAQPVAKASEPEPAAKPLPKLNDSDPEIRAALTALLPAKAPVDLSQSQLVRKITQLVTTAADGYLPLRQRLIATPQTQMQVVQDGDTIYLDSDSYHRFDRYANTIAATSTEDLLHFLHTYGPLFQQAFSELGLPKEAFTDNLKQTLDLLLATPEPQEPIKLVQPKVMYQYADPALEKLKPVQKILLRMGPDNRAKIKAKLAALRQALR